jgi:hypothetical protein
MVTLTAAQRCRADVLDLIGRPSPHGLGLVSWKEKGDIICGEGQATTEIMTDNQERKKIAEWELKMIWTMIVYY